MDGADIPVIQVDEKEGEVPQQDCAACVTPTGISRNSKSRHDDCGFRDIVWTNLYLVIALDISTLENTTCPAGWTCGTGYRSGVVESLRWWKSELERPALTAATDCPPPCVYRHTEEAWRVAPPGLHHKLGVEKPPPQWIHAVSIRYTVLGVTSYKVTDYSNDITSG